MKRRQIMLFEPMFIIAGGATIGIALLEKTLEDYGYYAAADLIKVLLPFVGLIAGVYFLETNPILWWLR